MDPLVLLDSPVSEASQDPQVPQAWPDLMESREPGDPVDLLERGDQLVNVVNQADLGKMADKGREENEDLPDQLDPKDHRVKVAYLDNRVGILSFQDHSTLLLIFHIAS